MISMNLVARDLTQENAELREELQTARTELEEKAQFHSRFVQVTSSELRTPLAILFGYAKLLEYDNSGEVQTYARIITSQAWQLKNSLDLLLLMHQIDAGKVALRHDGLLLRQVVDRLADERQRDIAEKQLTLHAHVDDSLVVQADREKFPVILSQLLQHAIDRSPRGDSISIQAQAHMDRTVVSFRDGGAPVEPTEQKWAFDWARGDSKNPGRTGSDLGLILARALVELHGGEIWMENGGDRGCTVSFSIPSPTGSVRTAAG